MKNNHLQDRFQYSEQRLPVWIRRIISVILLALLVYGVLHTLERSLRRDADFSGYITMARGVVHDFNPYQADHRYRWPPSMAVIYSPLAVIEAGIGEPATRLLYQIFCWWCFFDTLGIAVRRIYGKQLKLRSTDGKTSITEPAIALAILVNARFLLSTAKRLQPTLILLWMPVKALDLLERKKDGRVAFLIGTAISIKLVPLIWIAYFAFCRRWKAVLLSLLWMGIWFASPYVVMGVQRANEFYASWIGDFGGEGKLSSELQTRASNQSVYAMFDRWIGHQMWPWVRVEATPDTLSSGSPIAKVATGMLLCVLVVACIACRRNYSRLTTPEAHISIRARRIVEEGLVVLLSLYASPLSWKHYYVVQFYPLLGIFALMAMEEGQQRMRTIIGLVVLAVLLQSAFWKSFVSSAVAQQVEGQSLIILGSLIYFGIGLYCSRKTGPGSTPSAGRKAW